MRILLDANLLVRAAITPYGLARKILHLIGAGEEHVLIVSSHLLAEVADVLSRPRIQARWPLPGNEIESYCQYLSAAGEEVKIRQLPPAISDPKDQAIIEAAVSGRAEVICTGDTHFYESPAREFLATHGINVMTDHDLLAVLGARREP
ncbi:MAG: putative toxin-antitoxin system toxin component, PIN family [Bryobacteraceae bacterium]